jgi:hypothetical protein
MSADLKYLELNKSGTIQHGFDLYNYQIKHEDDLVTILVTYPENYSELIKNKEFEKTFSSTQIIQISPEIKKEYLFKSIDKMIFRIAEAIYKKRYL